MDEPNQENVIPSQNNFCYKFPHPAVTADCCVFAFVENELSVLLIRRGIEPFANKWALPGGFMKIHETIEDCARRELFEETRFVIKRLTQFGVYSNLDRDPRERVLTVAFYALATWDTVQGGDDASEACWFPLHKLPPLAFDHTQIVHDALLRMRRDVYFEPVGFELLPPTFTMPELQKIIETITGEKYDRRNFYNKMRHSGFVAEDSVESIPFPVMIMKSSRQSEDFKNAEQPYPTAPDCEMSLIETDDEIEMCSTTAPRRRRGVKYWFKSDVFKKKRSEKGNTPITY